MRKEVEGKDEIRREEKRGEGRKERREEERGMIRLMKKDKQRRRV